MNQTFGDYIRQKRLFRMIKLNQFAKQIGISNVYLSYIESGKRPAPSTPILNNIADVLNLSSSETTLLYSLAALSHNHGDFPQDLLDYINSRPYIIVALRKSMENNATEKDWLVFQKLLDLKVNKDETDQYHLTGGE